MTGSGYGSSVVARKSSMDLLEYQAKELFREMDIPVLPSQKIRCPQDLKGLKIPYPIVLKSQVRAGGRGKAGGIRFATNTIDAIAAAQAIFHLPIQGELPEILLAEAKYNASQEFYLAILLDRTARRPVLLGSPYGGVEVTFTQDKMQRVVVDEEFSPFYARRLALKMGLSGEAIEAVSRVIKRMYRLFVQKDLDLVEINPLGIRDNGEVMALDGKVTVNNEALNRHYNLTRLLQERNFEPLNQSSVFPAHDFVEFDGKLAILCNGAGLTMATFDLVREAKGQPANFLNLGSEQAWYGTDADPLERLRLGLDAVTRSPQVSVVLVNLIAGVTRCQDIATTLVEFSEGLDRPCKWIVRLVGGDLVTAEKTLNEADLTTVKSLDEAVSLAVKAV